mmetsp:Transcript_18436/g.31534  ORF Transcript_18436/g.31534 Transcript_18436/m.31534 type:complete len:90 (-) Transcript_18436:599-868(-)
MGAFDVPAQINYVLAQTGQKDLTYIGHSMGTTQFFYALSQNEDYYTDKVNGFVALSPVARLRNSKSGFFKLFLKYKKELYEECRYKLRI